MKPARLLATVLVVILASDNAGAGLEGIRGIWQPLIVEGEGSLVLLTVPHATYTHQNWDLHHVTSENRVWSQRGFVNRNAANLASLVVRLKQGPTGDGLWGDTLRVALDATRIDPTVLMGVEPDTLIEATLACIRSSATTVEGGTGMAVHHLEVEILTSNSTSVRRWDLRRPFQPRTTYDIGKRH